VTRSQAGRLGAAITAHRFRQEAIRSYYESPNRCLHCDEIIHVSEGARVAEIRKKKFCGQSCSAIYNNTRRNRQTPTCQVCGTHVTKGSEKFCSVTCHKQHRHTEYIQRWKAGLEDGVNGGGMSISPTIRKYLFEQRGPACWKCGWSQVNPVTNRVPLQVNHIDGNPLNNKEENLELICPNCHSITPNFGALNMGNGREVRRARYHQKKVGAGSGT
jgi:hypothetical protein